MERVRLGSRSYPIHIEHSYRQLPAHLHELELPRHAWIVSHRPLLERFGDQLLPPLERAGFALQSIAVPESELAKSSRIAEQVLATLARRAATRIPLLLAFGGGVVGDLTGFVAAVFRRGIPYVQLPTTLLAQVDSSIGGKVGIDLPFAKNLIGAFYQPRLVFNHLGLLADLPPRQRRSGLSEIIKYGIMDDAELFRYLETHLSDCLAGTAEADRLMVERCCRIKARVVSRDERETKGWRIRLNLGHTLGHALESATGYRRFTHGEAIAIGMAFASDLAVAMGVLPESQHRRIVALFAAAGLPTQASGVSLAAVRRVLVYDKKFIAGKLRWVLPSGVGRVVVSDAVPQELAWQVMRRYVVG